MFIDAEKVAELVRVHIFAQRFTQHEVAMAVGTTRVYLNNFLNRKINFVPEQITKLLDVLDLWETAKSIGAVVEDDEPPPRCRCLITLNGVNLRGADV